MEIELDIEYLLEDRGIEFDSDKCEQLFWVDSDEIGLDLTCSITLTEPGGFYQGRREPDEHFGCEHVITDWIIMKLDGRLRLVGVHKVTVYGKYEDDTYKIEHEVERPMSEEMIRKIIAAWEKRNS